MSLYTIIKAEADKLFPADRIDDFMPEILRRVNTRTDINGDVERKRAIESAYRDIKSEYIAAELHEKRVEEMKKFIELYNSTDTRALAEAMFEAMSCTHRTIQSDFLGGMLKLMEKYSTAEPRHFDGRNAHWRGISERIVWTYYHPDKMDDIMGKRT